MAAVEPVTERNLDGYGADLIPWAKVDAQLGDALSQFPETGGPNRYTCWLATVRPDGVPHVVPVGAIWVDGAFYFTAREDSRKARNLAKNPDCVITVATQGFDLTVEGTGVKVTDAAVIRHIADRFAAQGWDASPDESGLALTAEYSAPSAGPPPWHVFKVTLATIFAFGSAEPYGATRWRF